jgi:Helicase associated domain
MSFYNLSNEMLQWEGNRRRSSMSIPSSRRDSILSVSLFDFALNPLQAEPPELMDPDPFAPLSIHEGIAMSNKYPERARHDTACRVPQSRFLTDRSECSVRSSSATAGLGVNTHMMVSPQSGHHQFLTSFSQLKMPATLNPITPDQCLKSHPFAPVEKPEYVISKPPLAHDSGDEDDDDDDEDSPHRFKAFHEEKWTLRYKELVEFHKANGHAAVPHTYPKNPQLARWVKRQRRQYKLRKDGRPSTMTTERLDLLNSVGFIWDSHDVNWREKLLVLLQFRSSQGHCNVPSNYHDKKLATWVKCQRRQYKLYWDGKSSAMTPERILELEKVGFEWEIRSASQRRVTTSDDQSPSFSISHPGDPAALYPFPK